MDINPNEKFIEHNIAELALRYDTIRGFNVNSYRITPDLAGGLKPVQRRALYSMYLDGGTKEFKKLATISGQVFGKFHPHCLHGDTEFLFTDGTKMTIEEMYNSEKNSYEVFSFNSERNGIFVNIIENIRITKYCTEIYEINFNNKSKLLCTDDHKVLVVKVNKNSSNKEFVKWVMVKDLKKGDLLYSGEIYNITKEECLAVKFDIPYISVKSINIIKYEKPIPMYDFTSINDNMQNAAIICGYRYNKPHNVIVVHNSTTSIEDAIVLMAQSWRNMIPLVEPSGNFGSISGDDSGASRYIRAKLSDYAIACFFDDWKNISL